MRLFIDTDIGDDIDDLLAIGLALKKGIDIVGITTVYREAKARVGIVKGLLDKMGKTIPVSAGHSLPLMQETKIFGALNYGLSTIPEISSLDPDDAVDSIIEAAETYKDDLTLLVIGAQTNIAKAYQKNPEAMSKIGKCVIMGGAFYAHNAEWNILCDPYAAKVVAESNMPIVYVSWDLTKDISIGKENCDYILNNRFDEGCEFIAENIRQWLSRNSYVPLLHDPAALEYCINPEWFEEEEIRVKVITSGEFEGFTMNLNTMVSCKEKELYPKHRVTRKANMVKIVDDFMSTLFNKQQ